MAIGRARTMDSLVSANVAQPRFRTLLLTIFAGVALALAAVASALACVGLAACYVPARRATRVDPAATLR